MINKYCGIHPKVGKHPGGLVLAPIAKLTTLQVKLAAAHLKKTCIIFLMRAQNTSVISFSMPEQPNRDLDSFSRDVFLPKDV